MRQKRAKAYRKLMSLYALSFGFHQPYQVLVDSEMCKSSIDLKLDLVKQLGIVLQGLIKPMITQCSIHELYLAGKSCQDAVDLAKTFERRKCNHREAIPGDDCLASVVGDSNKHRYVIASQSQALRVHLRTIPAVPIVHVNRSVMVLEPPSDVTLQTKQSTEEQSLHPSAPERALLPQQAATPPKKKRKGPKGPNPLSVKKKKRITTDSSQLKGKGKELAKSPTVAHEQAYGDAKTGTKRGRDEVDDLIEAVAAGESAARRRKRRRKALQSATGGD